MTTLFLPPRRLTLTPLFAISLLPLCARRHAMIFCAFAYAAMLPDFAAIAGLLLLLISLTMPVRR